MDLSGLISISGMSGLYKVVAQAKNGLIVESLTDKKRFSAYSSSKISALEEISIFSSGDNIPLKDVFQKIFDKENGGGSSIDHKSNDADLKQYFSAVVPDYDRERVYVSDIRKVINWYNTLQKQGLLNKKEEESSKENEEKPKIKATEEKTKNIPKTKLKDTSLKPAKPSVAKVKTQTTRKTGV